MCVTFSFLRSSVITINNLGVLFIDDCCTRAKTALSVQSEEIHCFVWFNMVFVVFSMRFCSKRWSSVKAFHPVPRVLSPHECVACFCGGRIMGWHSATCENKNTTFAVTVVIVLSQSASPPSWHRECVDTRGIRGTLPRSP